jgi:hypothetical protein
VCRSLKVFRQLWIRSSAATTRECALWTPRSQPCRVGWGPRACRGPHVLGIQGQPDVRSVHQGCPLSASEQDRCCSGGVRIRERTPPEPRSTALSWSPNGGGSALGTDGVSTHPRRGWSLSAGWGPARVITRDPVFALRHGGAFAIFRMVRGRSPNVAL